MKNNSAVTGTSRCRREPPVLLDEQYDHSDRTGEQKHIASHVTVIAEVRQCVFMPSSHYRFGPGVQAIRTSPGHTVRRARPSGVKTGESEGGSPLLLCRRFIVRPTPSRFLNWHVGLGIILPVRQLYR